MEIAVIVLGFFGLLFVLWAALGIAAFFQRAEQLERTADNQSIEDANAIEFEATQEADWPYRHARTPARNRLYLMLSADRSQIRSTRVQMRPEITILEETILPIASIVSVELQRDSKTVMKLESTGKSTSRGGLGRAAVGGLVFGGAGAVVGAVTAPTTTVTKTQGHSRTVMGPATLVIGTMDAETPVLKFDMVSPTEGERWLHLLRGSIALLENGSPD